MTGLVAAFLLTALVIELTPGPNMGYLALVSAVEGRREGLSATAGIALGLAIVGLAAAFGLAALLAASPLAFALLRWGGVAYLLWLAYEAWTSATELSPSRANHRQSAARHFRRGLIVNLLNPKAGIFFIAILPGFIDPTRAIAPQTALLTILYVVLATAIHLTIVALAGTAQRQLSDPGRQRLARRTFAVLLAGVAFWFLLETR
ncbi:LysE family translocator [Parasphingopyxis marina]|uniref:LysE family translocator n=1 Tax=Parasphingopyxis marina TaxID=2761622 RepID=A0A842HVT1_9SPHN|nr:LysE family translocator [Parasphingopyxis marina]MBC2776369.1 LysE family translocator [Parasphingopyxis marina]